MAESVYRVTEVIGVSSESWEAAARVAVETAAKTVRDLRIAEVLRQDITIGDGGVVNFRVRLAISCKYGAEEEPPGRTPRTSPARRRARPPDAKLVRGRGVPANVNRGRVGVFRSRVGTVDPAIAGLRSPLGDSGDPQRSRGRL